MKSLFSMLCVAGLLLAAPACCWKCCKEECPEKECKECPKKECRRECKRECRECPKKEKCCKKRCCDNDEKEMY